MRITNSMMTNNSKNYMNINKLNADNAYTVTASGQKITRPSDDPVVAIRALRLNTNLTELKQYSDKNIPDAEAWFDLTSSALSETNEIISKIEEQLTTGASDQHTATDRSNILKNLSALRDQIYATGNSDYTGRTIFTGYRTGESLTFTKNESKKYTINEPLSKSDVETISYVSGAKEISNTSVDTTYTEQSIENNEVYRLRLAYGNIDNNAKSATLTYTAEDGTEGSITPNIVTLTGDASKDDKFYTTIGPNDARIIADTGEVILGKNLRDTLANAKEISVKYSKTEWNNGDLRPEHYFMCTSIESDGKEVEYNYNRVDEDGNPTTDKTGTPTGFKNQDIEIEVSYNQSIAINTHADDVFTHDIGRDVDELIAITEKVIKADEKVANIEKLQEEGKLDADTLDKMYLAATKERDLLKEKMTKTFQGALTTFKGYENKLSDEISRVGSMQQRLELTKNRVSEQTTNMQELSKENIGVDLTEAATDYNNANLALQAAQLAAAKIADQTLLNYI